MPKADGVRARCGQGQLQIQVQLFNIPVVDSCLTRTAAANGRSLEKGAKASLRSRRSAAAFLTAQNRRQEGKLCTSV